MTFALLQRIWRWSTTLLDRTALAIEASLRCEACGEFKGTNPDCEHCAEYNADMAI